MRPKRSFILTFSLVFNKSHVQKFRLLFSIVFIFGFTNTLISCIDYKKIVYFRDVSDSTSLTTVGLPVFKNPTIKQDDLIFISIQTIDPNVSGILNSGNLSSPNLSNNASLNLPNSPNASGGYLVDSNGEVDLPIIGKVKLKGHTTSEAKNLIHQRAALFFKDPIVNVRFTNFRITVLGEVAKPSTYLVSNEKVSIIDAIGMAGDLTIFGKRENILLIREGGDSLQTKHLIRLNLNSKAIFSSPYFYLEPNDIIYVQPNKSKASSTDVLMTKYIAIATSILSLLIILFTRIVN